jgi:hypothetical protein
MAVIDFLAKDNIRDFTADEYEFLYECMLEMKYITPTGLTAVKALELPDASGVLEPVGADDLDVTNTNAKLSEEDLLILSSKPVYTRLDISDANINPDFDIDQEEDDSLRNTVKRRIDAYCQRTWYECHSHIPYYGGDYYYKNEDES